MALPFDELNAGCERFRTSVVGSSNSDSAPATSSSGSATGSNFTPTQQAYGESSYWESLYEEKGGLFDWYATYNELSGVFRDYSPPSPDAKVLMIGCGNSVMSQEMHEAGFRKIENIDIAASVVEKMKVQFASLELEWKVMDATALEYQDNSFDLSIDKGTVDALMHGADCIGEKVAELSAETWRTLRPGGIFLLISHNRNRLGILNAGLQQRFNDEGLSWERLEVRQCRLSPQATLINILRSKLNGQPLSHAFKDTELLQQSMKETREAMRRMAFQEVFREFKARKRRAAAAKAAAAEAAGENPAPAAAAEEDVGEESNGKPKAADDSNVATEDAVAAAPTPAIARKGPNDADSGDEAEKPSARDPRLQPFCWCYILRKAVA
mmetsp:Transcript_97721/g.203911  ORF Transcript_97721/g.203911 Transcript_97721/m.203911 type:complete len:383 (-) Transcript_97721:46-1194(-)